MNSKLCLVLFQHICQVFYNKKKKMTAIEYKSNDDVYKSYYVSGKLARLFGHVRTKVRTQRRHGQVLPKHIGTLISSAA